MLTLYARTREPEFAAANWDALTLRTFLELQFKTQSQYYKMAYPEADNRVVLLGQDPIGRFIVDRGEREITLVDITLLPEKRNAGIGSNLVKKLIAEAAADAKPVRLHVLNDNPARRLYERLGFSAIGGDGVYVEMKWSN